MTLQDFGSIGEVVGAIGVVATLIYLTKQIRLNTVAMEEARKLALAQTYQLRSDALQAMMVSAADSEHIGPIIIKLTELGYPEDVTALDQVIERRASDAFACGRSRSRRTGTTCSSSTSTAISTRSRIRIRSSSGFGVSRRHGGRCV